MERCLHVVAGRSGKLQGKGHTVHYISEVDTNLELLIPDSRRLIGRLNGVS